MRFLQDAWYPVAQSSDIAADRPFARTLLGQPLLLFRDEEGTVKALHDRCPHRFAPLSEGRVSGGRVHCPYHGLQFDGRGACVHNPHGDGVLPKAAAVRAYPMRERHGLVWAWPGDAARSETIGLPDLGEIDPADAGSTFLGYLRSDANFEIVIDNLLDLSHADFLHASLLSTNGAILRTPPSVEAPSNRRVEVTLDMPAGDFPIMPIFRPFMPHPDKPARTHMHITWHAPCIVDIVTTVSQQGPEGLVTHRTRGLQLLAPETDTTTHYHVLGHRTTAADDPAVSAAVRSLALAAFSNEDGPILKAVQDNLGGRHYHEMQPMLLSSDAGAMRVRRAYDSLLKEQTQRA